MDNGRTKQVVAHQGLKARGRLKGLCLGGSSRLYRSDLALSAASREAEQAREELQKLTLVESLKEHCVTLGPVPDPMACQEARNALGDLTAQPWSERQLTHLSRILTLSEGLEKGLPPDELAALHRAVSDFERSVIRQVERDLRHAEKPAHRFSPTIWRASCGAGSSGPT